MRRRSDPLRFPLAKRKRPVQRHRLPGNRQRHCGHRLRSTWRVVAGCAGLANGIWFAGNDDADRSCRSILASVAIGDDGSAFAAFANRRNRAAVADA